MRRDIESLRKYPEIIGMIKSLPISDRDKKKLLKMGVSQHNYQKGLATGVAFFKRPILTGNIDLLVKSSMGRTIILHEICHAILNSHNFSLLEYPDYPNSKKLEIEIDAWQLTEVFLGRRTVLKDISLNSYKKYYRL